MFSLIEEIIEVLLFEEFNLDISVSWPESIKKTLDKINKKDAPKKIKY